MNKKTYTVHKLADDSLYIFTSQGIHGNVEKMVFITQINDATQVDSEEEIYYNLAFGDLKIMDGDWTIDDSSRSNNGDMPKVIATVAQIALEFLSDHRDAILSFSGFMDAKSLQLGRNQRTNLYQRAIDSNISELTELFEITGVNNSYKVSYTPGTSYDTILIRCKK